MLSRKMRREILRNFGQFLSIFILAMLAVMLFACMKASNVSAYHKQRDMYRVTNTADGWIYGEGFSEEALEKIRSLKDVKDAQRRMHVTANAKEHDQAQLEVYLMEEAIVSKPFYISGAEFDLSRENAIWMSESFANAWDLKVGDSFTFVYRGIEMTKEIAGLIVAPEYQYMKADKDLDVVVKNISVIYMAYREFPVKDYVKSLIDKGDLTLEDVAGHSEFVREKLEAMEKLGIARESITKEQLSKLVDEISEEKLRQMLPYIEIIFTTSGRDVKSMEQEISDALNGDYAVLCDRNDIAGIKVMADELSQHDQFAVSFPTVFIAIALLVIMTSMNRMISQQRTQIGTLRALGMRRSKIILHYLSYSFWVSFLGAIVGLFLGTYVMGDFIAKVFRAWYYIPGWSVEMDGSFLVVVVLIVLACTGATYLSCRKVMEVRPAESLRPAAPKAGKKILCESLPFWNRLGFNIQYNLRDISRGKLRALMGVLGTAAGMMMMVAAFSSLTTIQNASDWTFEKLQNFKTQIDFDGDVTLERAQELREQVDGELIQTAAVEFAVKEHAKSTERKSTILIVTEGKNLFRLTDEKQRLTELAPGTIAITKKLAEEFDLKAGDTIYWHLYEKNDWYEAKVGLINRNPSMQGITMLREDYEKTGATYLPTVLYSKDADPNADVRNAQGVLAVHDDADLRESFDVMMQMIYLVLGVFMIFAMVLPVVVLYNSGNLSFNERLKEFATLKVLGFQTGAIRRLLSLQNLWLSVIGIVLGAPFGTKLLQFMFDSNGDSMDYQVMAGAFEYLVSGAFVLVISLLVGFLFQKKIRRLDMVETLKGIE
ncbi:MAG: FtsX-like permease family protein [Lachnospiraceae bacterium]|nr:FtsX-like permease family protein [Lachnospiraceae bacterium]